MFTKHTTNMSLKSSCLCSNHVRLAATNALLNSLEFTRANFDMEVSGSLLLRWWRSLSFIGNFLPSFMLHTTREIFILLVGTSLYHASGLRGDTVNGHTSACSSLAVPCQDHVFVLPVYGTLYGACSFCRECFLLWCLTLVELVIWCWDFEVLVYYFCFRLQWRQWRVKSMK